ncbi:uncharacterized protein LOC133843362 isoform X1 [Drosophila sulfurigaster albostrigata]|uniref:uncharacterized protein LOC133843362 isoform X1 n=1 Tax=Drosophila sulfurigaster albostrigata TaxID=89887 RepID=UPI002D21A47B|nr:uncharacterized protein LOC133843362 isoform X1 [Drosophila sulfurigaster albostrigata]
MPTMKHLLLLSVIIASLHLAVSAHTSEDYYDDTEAPQQPGNLEKVTEAPIKPFFKEGHAIVYANRSAERVKLDCPVQNYDGNHHVIMWYQDGSAISSGNKSMAKDITIDDRFTLTVPLENATHYNFSCLVQPHEVRRYVTIQYQTASGASSISWPAVMGCIFVVATAFLHPATPRY